MSATFQKGAFAACHLFAKRAFEAVPIVLAGILRYWIEGLAMLAAKTCGGAHLPSPIVAPDVCDGCAGECDNNQSYDDEQRFRSEHSN